MQTNLQVINRHRRDIAKGHGLVSMLFQQLEQAAKDREELENLVEEETKGDENNQRRNKLMKAISLPTHAAVLRDLSTSLKISFHWSVRRLIWMSRNTKSRMKSGCVDWLVIADRDCQGRPVT